jgi:hypothetical protein
MADDLDTEIKKTQLALMRAKAGIAGGCAMIIAIPLLIMGVILLFLLYGMLFG